MQDRFKFRFWHKPTNKMLDCYGFNEHCTFANTLDGIGTEYNPCATKDCELMQCTGLKDKNSKLIYEGDILIQKEENAGPTKKLVIWEEDGGYLGLKDLKKSFFGVVTFHRFSYTYEVIGNIYENPELLEVEE